MSEIGQNFCKNWTKYGCSQMLTKILYSYNSSKQRTDLENYYLIFNSDRLSNDSKFKQKTQLNK